MSLKGTVSKWIMAKGYGWISGADGTDVFVHHTGIVGGRRLVEGSTVNYDIDSEHSSKSRRGKAAQAEGKQTACNVSGPGVVAHVAGSKSGIVKEWHPGRGYGFIQATDGAKVYVHNSSFEGARLEVGKTVTFDVEDVEHKSGRMVAINVDGAAVQPEGANTGVVKMWSAERGFGFIEDASTGKEAYVNSKMLSGGYLVEGKEVHYDVDDVSHDSGRLVAKGVTGPGVRDNMETGMPMMVPMMAKGGRKGGGRMAGGMGGPEKRRDTDGKYYTKEEFYAQYGGYAEWDSREERMSPANGKFYTKDEFMAHFGGLAEWNAAGGKGGARFTPFGGRGRGGRGRGA